jgi:hypothetical protein
MSLLGLSTIEAPSSTDSSNPDDESSSYSDVWTAPTASMGLFTTIVTFRRGDLVRLSKTPGSHLLYRVSSVRPPKKPSGAGSTILVLREVISCVKLKVSTRDVRPLGRDVDTGMDDAYDSGFSPGFLNGISNYYIFLVGSRNYQVALFASLWIPEKWAVKPIGPLAKRVVSRLETVASGDRKDPLASGWKRVASRKGGSVLVALPPFKDGESWSREAQSVVYQATRKARKGVLRGPRKPIIVVVSGEIPLYGTSASAEAYEAKYLGHDVFFFSCVARLSVRQSQAVIGLSKIGDALHEVAEGRLDVPYVREG